MTVELAVIYRVIPPRPFVGVQEKCQRFSVVDQGWPAVAGLNEIGDLGKLPPEVLLQAAHNTYSSRFGAAVNQATCRPGGCRVGGGPEDTG